MNSKRNKKSVESMQHPLIGKSVRLLLNGKIGTVVSWDPGYLNIKSSYVVRCGQDSFKALAKEIVPV